MTRTQSSTQTATIGIVGDEAQTVAHMPPVCFSLGSIADAGIWADMKLIPPSVLRGSNVHRADLQIGTDWIRWSGPAENRPRAMQVIEDILGTDAMGQYKPGLGWWFYQHRHSYSSGINVCWSESSPDGNDARHFTVEITGRGINQLGQYAIYLINKALHELGCQGTRVDVACDWHNASIGFIQQVQDACRDNQLRIARSYEIIYGAGSSGTAKNAGVSIGSRLSNKYGAIYDKQLEQGSDKPWVRFEPRFNGDAAKQVCAKLALMEFEAWPQYMEGLIAGWVDFREGSRKVARQRCKRPEWWSQYIEHVQPVQIRVKRSKTTFDGLLTWLQKCVFPALKTFMQIGRLDADQLMDLFANDVHSWEDAIHRSVVYDYLRWLKDREDSADLDTVLADFVAMKQEE
ncbi:MAG: replication initiation factor domain-containing protein [Phycisphaeraceae bacterium JB051]